MKNSRSKLRNYEFSCDKSSVFCLMSLDLAARLGCCDVFPREINIVDNTAALFHIQQESDAYRRSSVVRKGSVEARRRSSTVEERRRSSTVGGKRRSSSTAAQSKNLPNFMRPKVTWATQTKNVLHVVTRSACKQNNQGLKFIQICTRLGMRAREVGRAAGMRHRQRR